MVDDAGLESERVDQLEFPIRGMDYDPNARVTTLRIGPPETTDPTPYPLRPLQLVFFDDVRVAAVIGTVGEGFVTVRDLDWYERDGAGLSPFRPKRLVRPVQWYRYGATGRYPTKSSVT